MTKPPLPDWEIDIHIADSRWEVLTQTHEQARACITLAMQCFNARPFAELSIALCDGAALQDLNKRYRGLDKPTNVLSFGGHDESEGFTPLLGDIVLSYDQVASEAVAKNISLADHTTHLIVHGFLHLQCYDHENEADALVMEALEIKILAGLGLGNPYDIKPIS